MNYALIYPFEPGLVVVVHANGAVWTRYYAHDLEAIADLFYVQLLNDNDCDSFFGEFALPDWFDTAPLLEAGFCRSTPGKRSGERIALVRKAQDLAA